MPSTKGRHDQSYGPSAWRTSALPTWNSTGMEDDSLDVDGPPPYKGHRWLPLRQNDTNLNKTPISKSAYAIFSPNWGSWAIGAQTHYSFLQNLERNQLDKFYFADGDGREAIWNMAYGRANINCIAIWGDDIRNNFPFPSADDEEYLSVTLPRKLNRRTYTPFARGERGKHRESIMGTDLADSALDQHLRPRRPFQFRPPTGALRHRSTKPLSRLCQRDGVHAQQPDSHRINS